MLEIEFRSGLGDILNVMFSCDTYARLEDLSSEAKVHVLSQNPYVRELFLWHPKAAKLSIHTHGLCVHPNVSDHESWPVFDQTRIDRWLASCPASEDHRAGFYRGARALNFYPSPRDISILERLRGVRFAVVCTSAGSLSRNIPVGVCLSIVAVASRLRLPLVACGRNYVLASQPSNLARKEQKLLMSGAVLDLIDQLTLPGTLELVRMASAVICCHSSMCLMAWHTRKPVFLLCPPEILAQKPKDIGSREFVTWWTNTKFDCAPTANFQEYQSAKLAACPPAILATNPTGRVALEFISWWFGTSFANTVCLPFADYAEHRLFEFLNTHCKLSQPSYA
jgi:hypothetical protein